MHVRCDGHNVLVFGRKLGRVRKSVGRARDEDRFMEPGTLHIYAKVKGATTTVSVPLLGSLVCRMCNPKNLCTLCPAPCGDDAALRLLVGSDCERALWSSKSYGPCRRKARGPRPTPLRWSKTRCSRKSPHRNATLRRALTSKSHNDVVR